MSNPVNLTIDPKVIEGVISAQVQAGIAAQFSRTPEFLEKLVAAVLTKKVDEKGTFHGGNDSYYNRHDLIEVLSHQAIKSVAEAALREWVDENKDKVKAAIRARLLRNQKKLVQLFVDAAEKAVSPDFQVSCTLKLSSENT